MSRTCPKTPTLSGRLHIISRWRSVYGFDGLDDSDALITGQRQQMLTISRYDQVGVGCDSGGDDLIVIGIVNTTRGTMVGSTNLTTST